MITVWDVAFLAFLLAGPLAIAGIIWLGLRKGWITYERTTRRGAINWLRRQERRAAKQIKEGA